MAKYSIESNTLSNIANAIRIKLNSTNSIKVNEMATKISEIKNDSNANIKTCTLTIVNNTDDWLINLNYVTFDGTNVVPIYTQNSVMGKTIYDGDSLTINNILIGSIFKFEEMSNAYTSIPDFNNDEYIDTNTTQRYGLHIYTIPNTVPNNSSIILTISN